MSGSAPETERERQLRQFANIVLAYPDADGPATVDLLPIGYPDDVPPELVDYSDLRFLGSVVRRRERELLGIELLFESATAQTTCSSGMSVGCSMWDGNASTSPDCIAEASRRPAYHARRRLSTGRSARAYTRIASLSTREVSFAFTITLHLLMR